MKSLWDYWNLNLVSLCWSSIVIRTVDIQTISIIFLERCQIRAWISFKNKVLCVDVFLTSSPIENSYNTKWSISGGNNLLVKNLHATVMWSCLWQWIRLLKSDSIYRVIWSSFSAVSRCLHLIQNWLYRLCFLSVLYRHTKNCRGSSIANPNLQGQLSEHPCCVLQTLALEGVHVNGGHLKSKGTNKQERSFLSKRSK